jgi:hypothetical protein
LQLRAVVFAEGAVTREAKRLWLFMKKPRGSRIRQRERAGYECPKERYDKGETDANGS